MQFSNGWNNAFGNPHLELEADALSGFYMCLYKNYPWSSTGLQGYFTSSYNTGDYNFNSPGHHGTPQQRLAASYLGFELAQYAINNNNTFTWGQLHQMITDSLRQNIVGWKTGNPNSPLVAICSGKKDVKDIQPGKLSEEEKRKLRPTSDRSE
ncbi:MAG: hypothetical protein Fur0041_12280 [Bacteroidia bacterium]